MFNKFLKLTILLLGSAVIYNLFLIPTNLVAGGTGGLGILFDKLFGIEPYVIIFTVSAFMVFLSCIFLNAKNVLSTIYIIVIYPLFVKLISLYDFSPFIKNENILTIVLISAIISGFLQGSIFKMGFNIGGLSVLAQIINKYFKISIALINTIINIIIVFFGAFVFGIENLLYAVLFLVICKFVSERVILGTSRNKTFKIISSEYKKIEKYIENNIGSGVTVYNTHGAYNNRDRKLLMTVITNKDFIPLRDYVESIDKKAFIFVSDTYEVKSKNKLIKESVK